MLRLLISLPFCFLIQPAEARVKKSVAYAPAPMTTSSVAETKPKTTIGFEGGVGLGQTEMTEEGATKEGTTRQSFGGGLSVDFFVNRAFSVTPGLFYLSKGITVDKTEFRFDFLELPILAKFRFTDGGFRPFVFAGPSVGIPLSKQSIAADGATSNVDGGGLVDISAQAGLGAEIDLGSNVGLVLSGRYLHGFVDQTTNPTQTFYNRTLLFTTGFRIGL